MDEPELQRRYFIGAHAVDAKALPPGLYLVATPIGNLGDITLRALETLAAVDIILCEDTRVTAKLLERYGIRKPLRPCHDHNEASLAARVADDIAAGKAIAFASDAGTPLVSDPGFRLVQAMVDRGLRIEALPGASAVLPALQLSALPADRFAFLGFLPQGGGDRRRFLEAEAQRSETWIVYESPHRLREALADISTVLAARPMAMARELTKLHEEVQRGSASDILAALASREVIKGECVLVIAGAAANSDVLDDTQIARIIAEAADALPAGKAAQQVAKLTGLSRDEAFARILKAKGK